MSIGFRLLGRLGLAMLEVTLVGRMPQGEREEGSGMQSILSWSSAASADWSCALASAPSGKKIQSRDSAASLVMRTRLLVG